jgi:hypothetical protein
MVRENLKETYKDYCKISNNPLSYGKFIEYYSRNKMSFEEVLKIPKR